LTILLFARALTSKS